MVSLRKEKKGTPIGRPLFIFQLSIFLTESRILLQFGGSSNGRTAAFEAVNRGSIPCPPATCEYHALLRCLRRQVSR